MGAKTIKTNFDYSKLKGRIVECGLKRKAVAAAAGMSEATFTQKLGNRYEFSQSEITAIANILQICTEDIPVYFFAGNV